MSYTIAQLIVATLMVAIAFALVYAVRAYMAAASERRMTSMLERVGVDPAVATSANHSQIIREVRKRCHRCNGEAVCERWLAGEEQGDNDFCPNAAVFATLRNTLAQH